MRIQVIPAVALVCTLAALLTPISHGAIIVYDNIGSAPDGVDSVRGIGPLYDSFTSASSAAALSGLDLVLKGPGGTGTLTVGLYADASTTPGSLITTLGTINTTVLTGSTATYTVSLSSHPVLAANTRYWIGLVDSGTSASWAWGPDISGPGVSGEYFSNSSGTFSNSKGPYQMRVTVPEPSACALFIGIGALGFAASRRLRRA